MEEIKALNLLGENEKLLIYQGFFGSAPGAIRTRDLLIRNQLLYPTELQAL